MWAPSCPRVISYEAGAGLRSEPGRAASGSLFRAPLTFVIARKNWRRMRAHAPAYHPQATQRRLLRRNNQKPTLRRSRRWEPAPHAAATVTAIAGH